MKFFSVANFRAIGKIHARFRLLNVIAILSLMTTLSVIVSFSTAVSATSSLADNPVLTQVSARLIGKVTLVGDVDVGNLPSHSSCHAQCVHADISMTPQPPNHADLKKVSSARAISASPSHSVVGPRVVKAYPGFVGINETTAGGLPPDVEIATGINHVMELVNDEGGIWTKAGVSIKNFSFADFFLTSAFDHQGDPRLIFDAFSGRWFATEADWTNGSLQLAVSKTSDPTGNWSVYSLPGCVDYPQIGISADKFVISTNLFVSPCFGSFVGNQFLIFDKANLTGSSPSVVFQSTVPDPNQYAVVPAQSLSNTNTMYMANAPDGGSNLTLYSIKGKVPGAIVSRVDLSIQPLGFPPSAAQKGTNHTFSAAGREVAWYKGKLWLSTADGCIPSGDTGVRACLRFVQVDTAKLRVLQDFDFGTAGYYYFYPGLKIDAVGDLDVVFGFSSATNYPSLAVTGQTLNDPRNTLTAPQTIFSGTRSNPDGRYGDYFAVAIDPIDPTLAWTAGEYYTTGIFGLAQWSTFIGRMRTLTTISVGGFPSGIAYDKSNHELFVSNFGDNDVSVINGSTRSVVTTIPVGKGPQGIAYDDLTKSIYVANTQDNTVSVIDGVTNNVTGVIPLSAVSSTPNSVAYDSANGRIYAAGGGSTHIVSVIKGNILIGTINVGNGPQGICYDSTNDRLYVTDQLDNNVSVVNPTSGVVVSTIRVGSAPIGIVFDSMMNFIYVADYSGNKVTVIRGSMNILIASVKVGSNPLSVAFDPSNHFVYVVDSGGGSGNKISKINDQTNKVIATITIGNVNTYPRGIVSDLADNNVYVTEANLGTVTIVQ